MLRDLFARGLARALVLLGALILALFTSFGASASEKYAACAETTTDVTLDSSVVRSGDSTDVAVGVTSDAGMPNGTVTVQVAGGAPTTLSLVNGGASWTAPGDLEADRTYNVTARYNGEKEWCASTGAANLTVSGGEVAGGSGDGDGDVAGASGEGGGAVASGGDDGVIGEAASVNDSAGLPGVGMDSTTQIAALAGLALVVAGVFALVRHRRLSH